MSESILPKTKMEYYAFVNLAEKMKGVWVKCDKCGHVWIYRGKLQHVVCSNCLKRTNINKIKLNLQELENNAVDDIGEIQPHNA